MTSLAQETGARRPQECDRGRHDCLRHAAGILDMDAAALNFLPGCVVDHNEYPTQI